MLKMTPEECAEQETTTITPQHALSEGDKARIKADINTHELESGFPCAHHEHPLYFHDGTYKWPDIWKNYVKAIKEGDRVVSMNIDVCIFHG